MITCQLFSVRPPMPQLGAKVYRKAGLSRLILTRLPDDDVVLVGAACKGAHLRRRHGPQFSHADEPAGFSASDTVVLLRSAMAPPPHDGSLRAPAHRAAA